VVSRKLPGGRYSRLAGCLVLRNMPGSRYSRLAWSVGVCCASSLGIIGTGKDQVDSQMGPSPWAPSNA
jgi:hypothetical protein